MKFTLKQYNIMQGLIDKAYREAYDEVKDLRNRRNGWTSDGHKEDAWPLKGDLEAAERKKMDLYDLMCKFKNEEI